MDDGVGRTSQRGVRKWMRKFVKAKQKLRGERLE
jgi:hypothetical protein